MTNEIIIQIENSNEADTDELRDLLKTEEFTEIVSGIDKEIEKIAEQIVTQLIAHKPKACPCLISRLLANLPPAHLDSLILVQSRMAAVKLKHGENDIDDYCRLISHAIIRRAEIEADETLEMSEFEL